MRILFCNYEYPPLGGGGGVISALLAEELAKRHEVTVLTSRALDLPPESKEGGVKIIRVPVIWRREEAVASLSSMLSFVFTGLRAGKKLLSTEAYDIINTHFVLPSGPVGAGLARFGGIPNVLTLHGGDLYDPSKRLSPHRHALLRVWIRSLLRRSDIVVGQSKNTLNNMRHYYTPEIEGVRIPLGIRRVSVSPKSRSSYGFDDKEILFVTVGRLIARKAVGDLIKLLHLMRQDRLRLLIVGSGPQDSTLKTMASNLGVLDRIRFVGQVDENEKFRILQMSDVYVSTSQHEGFGLVFVEAMSCGLPVVCYDCGGQTDFLEDGLTGCILPLNDLHAFTEACRRLAIDPELRRRMGRENRRRVEELYVERCAQRYEDVFQEAIERRALQELVKLSGTRKLPLTLAKLGGPEAASRSGPAFTRTADDKATTDVLR